MTVNDKQIEFIKTDQSIIFIFAAIGALFGYATGCPIGPIGAKAVTGFFVNLFFIICMVYVSDMIENFNWHEIWKHFIPASCFFALSGFVTTGNTQVFIGFSVASIFFCGVVVLGRYIAPNLPQKIVVFVGKIKPEPIMDTEDIAPEVGVEVQVQKKVVDKKEKKKRRKKKSKRKKRRAKEKKEI